MGFLGGLTENIIASIVSVPIIAFLSFLIYKILREMFRGKFYTALFSALSRKSPKYIERYRLQHYIKHSFVLEDSEDERETDAAVFSYKKFIKKVKTTKFVILTGSAGIGKSKLMQRLALQFRTHIKGADGEGIKNYGILFKPLKDYDTVEQIVSSIKADIGNSQTNYTLFLDGLDEMRGLQQSGGDEILKDLVRTLEREVAGSCKTIFISLRPEILGKGFSFSDDDDIYDTEIAIFRIRNFNEKQILKMYRNESRITKKSRRTKKRKDDEDWEKIPAKKRRENFKKLKTVVKNNPESVFTYPLILTWANEILSGKSVEQLQHISWYAALDEVVRFELERECDLYRSTKKSDPMQKQDPNKFVRDGRDFLKEIAVKMALSNEQKLTAEEIFEGTVAKRLSSEYGETPILARHLLQYIDWSEKGGSSVFYEFLHNAIYWYALAAALLDPNTPQDLRAQIVLKEAENKYSTPLLQYCRQGLWYIYGGRVFPYRDDELAYQRDIEKKTVRCNTNRNAEGKAVPLEVVLTCCYGLNEVILNSSIRFTPDKIRQFVEEKRLILSYANIHDLAVLEYFSERSFEVLDCALSHIEQAIIPNYVKEVNFERCASLRKISFPDDSCLSKIGTRAFEHCTWLTDVKLSNNLKVIGEYAFTGCTSLASIEIPDSVTSIEEGAFFECTSLTDIKLSNQLTKIGAGAFLQCTSLTSIKIPDSVISIEPLAFAICTSLTSIKIPDKVTSIEKNAFLQCTSLTDIKLSNNLTVIGEGTFQECTSLASIEIPDSVISIEKGAFLQCTSLTDIKLSNQLTKIGAGAFLKCTSLTSVEIPDSVISIEEAAFIKCTSLTDIKLSNNLTVIGEYAFQECTSLTSVEIPDSVTSIEQYAFSICTSLTSIKIPDKVTSIEEAAFCRCTSLTDIKLSNNLTVIGKGTFHKCTSLTSIKIPDKVKGIGEFAFQECTSLTSIKIPDSVISIEEAAFSICTSLTSIKIPDSITSIERDAFWKCTSLTSIEIPNSVTKMERNVFAECPALARVTYRGTIADWNKIERNDSFCGSNVSEIVCKDGSVQIG